MKKIIAFALCLLMMATCLLMTGCNKDDTIIVQTNAYFAPFEYMDGGKPNQIYWVAVVDTPEGEEIAGLVFLFNKKTGVPWLGIGVSEKWKGRRIGGLLMDAAREWAESVGAGGILLSTAPENLRAPRLYERKGYVKIGTQENGELLYLLAFPNENVK